MHRNSNPLICPNSRIHRYPLDVPFEMSYYKSRGNNNDNNTEGNNMRVQTEYLVAEITQVDSTYRFEVVVKAHPLRLAVEEQIEALEFKWEKGNVYIAHFDPEFMDELIVELTSGIENAVDNWIKEQDEENEGRPDYGIRNSDFIA